MRAAAGMQYPYRLLLDHLGARRLCGRRKLNVQIHERSRICAGRKRVAVELINVECGHIIIEGRALASVPARIIVRDSKLWRRHRSFVKLSQLGRLLVDVNGFARPFEALRVERTRDV